MRQVLIYGALAAALFFTCGICGSDGNPGQTAVRFADRAPKSATE